ncbi:hypothetical protein D9M71_676570 [compost metagenome]
MLVGERLADKIGNPRLDRLDDVFLVTTAGHHDELQVFQRRLLTAPGEQFQAGHFRHLPVAQHQVERFLAQHGHGLATVDRVVDDHAREGIAQALADQVTDKRGVIHDQHIHFTHRYSL